MSNLTVTDGVLRVKLGSLSDGDFSPNANQRLTIGKRRHRIPVRLRLTGGTNVTALSKIVHIAGGAGVVAGVVVTPSTAPTGGDLKWTVDVLKSTGGGALASILPGGTPMDVDSTAANFRRIAVEVNTLAYVDDDLFQIVVAVSGSTGSQGQGGEITLWLDEASA